MHKFFLMCAAVSGFLAVILGAFAAHALKHFLDVQSLAIFQTGVQYQMYHALALLCIGLWVKLSPQTKTLNLSGLAFILGSLLFCGSLYSLALGAPSIVGLITPLGGMGFLAGWLLLILSARHI